MFTHLLKRIGRILSDGEIPYIIIGGQAALLYGEPRLTKDIDVTLGVSLDRLADVVRLVKKLKLRAPVQPETFTRETMVLPAEDPRTGIRVDFILSFS